MRSKSDGRVLRWTCLVIGIVVLVLIGTGLCMRQKQAQFRKELTVALNENSGLNTIYIDGVNCVTRKVMEEELFHYNKEMPMALQYTTYKLEKDNYVLMSALSSYYDGLPKS